jgi:hypothetical protein
MIKDPESVILRPDDIDRNLQQPLLQPGQGKEPVQHDENLIDPTCVFKHQEPSQVKLVGS